jgi:hypothetical protein
MVKVWEMQELHNVYTKLILFSAYRYLYIYKYTVVGKLLLKSNCDIILLLLKKETSYF